MDFIPFGRLGSRWGATRHCAEDDTPSAFSFEDTKDSGYAQLKPRRFFFGSSLTEAILSNTSRAEEEK